jgi:hypothetical protein
VSNCFFDTISMQNFLSFLIGIASDGNNIYFSSLG